jgi:hypothetical protein
MRLWDYDGGAEYFYVPTHGMNGYYMRLGNGKWFEILMDVGKGRPTLLFALLENAYNNNLITESPEHVFPK